MVAYWNSLTPRHIREAKPGQLAAGTIKEGQSRVVRGRKDFFPLIGNTAKLGNASSSQMNPVVFSRFLRARRASLVLPKAYADSWLS